ncbi:MAG: hypothetical protein IM674_07900 [Brevundimonas sp.]|nr:hypothetical protein [Brevundimonas sp.]
MSGQQFFIIEIVAFFGLFLGWAVWDLYSTRRSLKRDREAAAQPARHGEGQQDKDDGRSEPLR